MASKNGLEILDASSLRVYFWLKPNKYKYDTFKILMTCYAIYIYTESKVSTTVVNQEFNLRGEGCFVNGERDISIRATRVQKMSRRKRRDTNQYDSFIDKTARDLYVTSLRL